MKKLLVLLYLIGVTACASSQSPAQRYAKEHAYREFTSWDKIGKEMDRNDKKKPKEHKTKNNY